MSNLNKASIYEYINKRRIPTREEMIARTIEAAMIENEKEERLKNLYNLVSDEQNPYTNNPNELLRQYMIARSIQSAQQSKKSIGRGYCKGGSTMIDKKQKVSLSNHDIYNLLDGKTNILTYPELMEYENISDVLRPYNSCAILYMTSDNYGHWCALTKNDEKICFFDPYGGKNLPDQELKSIPQNFRNESGQTYPHLTYLLYKSNSPIEYNEHKYQKLADDVNTCGRHVVCRLLHKNLNSDQYYDMMRDLAKKNNMTYDEVVTKITENIKKNK